MKHTLIAIAALFAFPAFAMEGHSHTAHAGHKGHTMKSAAKKECKKCMCTPATKAYKKANRKMHKGMMVPYLGDVDTDFVRGMIPHHQGAVDMVDVVLEYGYDPEIRELAQWIKTTQAQEIAQMKHWLATRGNTTAQKGAKDAPSSKAFDTAMHAMHKAMDIKYSGDADVDFVRGMIPHHQGAIDMAEVVLNSGTDPFVMNLARDVVRTQSAEIAKMERFLEKKKK